MIKEVFYIGHYWVRDVRKWGMKNENQIYNDDQYIAIYNPTNEVKYLDGLALCANAIDPTKNIRFAPGKDFVNRYYGASSVSIFPGTGRDYPVNPKQTIIVAKYAIDHKAQFIKELEDEDLDLYKGMDAFLDLSHADFEWTNSTYATLEKNNPAVPDLIPLITGTNKKGEPSSAFEFNEVSERNGIALIRLPWTPEEFKADYAQADAKRKFCHYITVTSSAFADFYAIEIPFNNVIDCMTTCPKSTFQMRPSKLDKGYNAITDASFWSLKKDDYPKFSGLALTRRWDGRKFVDDDNSTTDFQVKVASLSRKDEKGNPIK